MTNFTYLHILPLLIFFSVTVISNTAITPQDTLNPGDSLTENKALVSRSQIFEFGFFTLGNSNNKYLGIWYKQIPLQTVVWVANRNTPIPTNSSGNFRFSNNKTSVELVDQKGNLIWASSNQNQHKKTISKPVLQLLDSGNLIIREESDQNPINNYLWQSFDYPSNTLLPGMKLGWDLKAGKNRFLTSWKNPEDPSVGNYSFEINPHGSPEVYVLRNGETRIYRSGPWNGVQFSGVPEMKATQDLKFSFVSTKDEISYTFSVTNASIVSRLVVTDTGFIKRLVWMRQSQRWNKFWLARKDQCDSYKACGAYGICDSNDSPICKCVKGFRPRNQREWDLRDGSGGCVRETEDFDCEKGIGFLRLQGMKLPDSESAVVDSRMDLKECEEECRKNCSCTAYASSDISGGGKRGCLIWFGDLIDLREYRIGGQDLFVRVPVSVLDDDDNNNNNNKKSVYVIVAVTITSAILIFLLIACFLLKDKLTESLWKRADSRVDRVKSQETPLFDVVISSKTDYLDDNKKDDLELPLFDFDTIANTTNNFSLANKLGEGGFGCVYKGTLADGQQVAVKRLSRNSRQGVEELKNEVMLIARLQHRNLVRLLGCCIEGKENILIYEYMQNKSLDSILFDQMRSGLLDWPKRFNIILGIARGLLYLHQDSRFRIIHRDLKAGNILLDEEMNPKISDFGMARIFGGDQAEANTRRVVGTYGYMSPEYAMDGIFSVKSDVFSYGVLVLEIISGMKNRGFYYPDDELNLLGHTWNLWEEGKGLELTDAAMGDSCSAMEVLKCIQVGLLCVQERAEDRPAMDSVILMLSSEFLKLPQPKQPGFCLGKTPTEIYTSSTKQQSYTANQVTVTMLEPR